MQAEPDRRAAASDHGLVEAHCAIGFRKRGPKDRCLWNELHGAADQIGRRAGMAHLEPSDSQKVQGICVRSIAIQERLVKAHRGERAGPIGEAGPHRRIRRVRSSTQCAKALEKPRTARIGSTGSRDRAIRCGREQRFVVCSPAYSTIP